MRTASLILTLVATPVLTVVGMGNAGPKPSETGTIAPVSQTAVAVVQPTEGNDARGRVLFEQVEDGVRVSGKIKNLEPGKHGFHVHEFGDLRKADGTSAGGHFNPLDKPHGGPEDDERHIGDLGNIEANENGVAEFSFVDPKLDFRGPASILGRGLIVHAGPDDLESQPAGAAGPRVGMAVIGYAHPEE
ncbi:MAG: superoxide dismutase family protein [Opitutales bacterium]